MLVRVVKLVELPEGVGRELIPSVVRLQPLDNCLRVWADGPEHLAAFSRRQGLGTVDREPEFPCKVLGQGVDADGGEREFVDEVVEGGAEVVEAVADAETELCRDGLGEFEAKELLAALSVEMTDVSVRFSLSPLANLRVETVQVMGSPT
jgi:hypothetical protein